MFAPHRNGVINATLIAVLRFLCIQYACSHVRTLQPLRDTGVALVALLIAGVLIVELRRQQATALRLSTTLWQWYYVLVEFEVVPYRRNTRATQVRVMPRSVHHVFSRFRDACHASCNFFCEYFLRKYPFRAFTHDGFII